MSSNNYSSSDSDSGEESSYEPSSNKDSDRQKSENESSENETQSDPKPNKIKNKSESTNDSDTDNSQKESDEEESDSAKSSEKIINKDTQSKKSDSDKSEGETKSSHDSDSERSKKSSEDEPEESNTSEDNQSKTKSIEPQEQDDHKKESETTSKQEKSSDSSDAESSNESSEKNVSKPSKTKSKETTKKSSSEKSNSSDYSSDKTKDEDNSTKEKESDKKKKTDSTEESEQAPFDFTVVPKNSSQNLKTDRYGWAIDEEEQDKKVTKKSKKLEKVDNEKERERESKWIYMMKKENWKKFYKKNGKYRKVLERRVKKGIPDCLRAKAWHLILDPHAIDEPTRSTIDSFYDKGVPSCDYVIRVDIPRTMPRVPMFSRKDVRISLYRVLRSYSNADPELGYYQGMAFSAAILLSYMDETSAFWSFVGLMKGKEHKLREFYDNNFTRLKEINKVWDLLLVKKFKDVHDNLKRNNIEHLLYTTSWFLCAFMNINFDTNLRLRIFDRFTLFGTRALMSFGLTIVDMNRADLATGAFDVVIPILQNPHLSAPMKNWRDIIKVYDKDFISKKDFKKYFKKAGVKL